MNIGILTQPLHHNYGGLLQNYALQRILADLGHNPITIDWTYKQCFVIRIFKRIKMLITKRECNYELSSDEKDIIYGGVHSFINHYLFRTTLLTKKKMFYSVIREYSLDGIVVGSDQTWRPQYNPFLYSMYVDFAKNERIKRIAYAASFGTDKFEYNKKQEKKCARLLKEFDAVSVREESAIRICNHFLGCEAVRVLDPTLLLSKEAYAGLINRNRKYPNDCLLYYILNPERTSDEAINRFAINNGLEPFSILPEYSEAKRRRHDVKKRISECIYPSVGDWLKAFSDSKMVVTDSFHGMVFSIIFHKNFWVVSNVGRGNSRFLSLLSVLELEDRLLSSIDDLEKKEFNSSIDWDSVDRILNKEKKQSIDFLIKSLQ